MTTRRRSRGVAWAVATALVAAANAQPAASAVAGGSSAGPRENIAVQRAAVEQRYVEQERECAQRFVVTSCLNDARQQRRNALAPLRQEELRIDMAERKQRAATRLEEIEAKQRADAARDAAAVPGPAASTRSAPHESEPARAPLVAPRRQAPIDAAERQRREAESEARFNANREQAARHRAEVERRNAERTARGKIARPLPVASGASAL